VLPAVPGIAVIAQGARAALVPKLATSGVAELDGSSITSMMSDTVYVVPVMVKEPVRLVIGALYVTVISTPATCTFDGGFVPPVHWMSTSPTSSAFPSALNDGAAAGETLQVNAEVEEICALAKPANRARTVNARTTLRKFISFSLRIWEKSNRSKFSLNLSLEVCLKPVS
jgi:hypothetical protein